MKNSVLPAVAALDDDLLDAVHGLVFEVLEKTLALSREQFPESYDEVIKKIELDFRSEEQLMEMFQCPDAHLHRAQHARMLAGLHHAGASLLQGDERPARRALAALADWLPFHIATQDRHLVRALRKRTDQFPQPTD